MSTAAENAGRNYGYAAAQARQADHWYLAAAGYRRTAGWLARHPARWTPDWNPAGIEWAAAEAVRLADVFLGCYWRYVDQARSYETGGPR